MPKNKKTRVSVTMTPPYIAALDTLVSTGLYLNRGEAVLEALRIFLKKEKTAPFYTGEETESSVTMTPPYVEALDNLVSSGLYLNQGEAVLEALRGFLKKEKITPFYNGEEPEPEPEVEEKPETEEEPETEPEPKPKPE